MSDLATAMIPNSPRATRSRRQHRALAGARPRRFRRFEEATNPDGVPDPWSGESSRPVELAHIVLHEALVTRNGDLVTIDKENWRRLLVGGSCPAFTPEEFDRTWASARPIICEQLRGLSRLKQRPLRLVLATSSETSVGVTFAAGGDPWI